MNRNPVPEFNQKLSTTTFPGSDDITRVELDNSIVVLSRANFNSPSVVVSGYMPVGGLFDPDEKLGLADFTVSALMRGTIERSFQEIFDALESAGASLSFNGATHTIGFSAKALAEDLDLLLELLRDALRRPAFPDDQVERLRTQLMTSLALRSQDTGEIASMAFDQFVYDGHPYSRPEDGYPETIQRITIADMQEFHGQHYGPKGMVIAVVGAVDPQTAVDKVEGRLGEWDNPEQPEPPALPPHKPLTKIDRTDITLPGKFQTDVLMGAAGPMRKSDDYLPAALGNSVLGQFGMMGRLGQVVREQRGLAYHVSSSLSGGLGPGPWYISAGVAPENVDQAIDLIRGEIARFIHEPINDQELSDSQSNFNGRFPLSLESNAGVAAALTNLERYQLILDYYRNYPDLIREITAENVLETAQNYLDPDRIAIATAGPELKK
mgnify:CR=1 FL=1